MLFRVSEIKPGHGYTFLIGSSSVPTNKLREEIERALAGVWAGLFEDESKVQDFGFDLIPDKSTPTGETDLPVLNYNKAYIIFALLESESGSAVGEQETTAGIVRAIERSLSNSKVKPRIGVVVLYNCTVQTLESKVHSGWAGFEPTVVKRSDLFRDDYPPLWRDRQDRFGGF